jgi:hypothetical protein
MQHDWSEGRTKEEGGAEKKKEPKKMNVKKSKKVLHPSRQRKRSHL